MEMIFPTLKNVTRFLLLKLTIAKSSEQLLCNGCLDVGVGVCCIAAIAESNNDQFVP